jgi:ribosomal protein S18 acetylase RimI-like enzyme
MSEVQIGFATPADAEAIAVLNRELLAFYEIPPPGAIPAVAEQIRRHGMGSAPGAEVLLARRWSELIGILIFQEMFSLAANYRLLFIQDLFVSERARGKGVGRKLMLRLGEVARERKIPHIDWTADKWNRDSQRFYRNLGSVLRGEKLVYRLSADKLGELDKTEK